MECGGLVGSFRLRRCLLAQRDVHTGNNTPVALPIRPSCSQENGNRDSTRQISASRTIVTVAELRQIRDSNGHEKAEWIT